MPYANPEDKKKAMKKWRKRVISQGYGKWLYERRKLRFDDAERFRLALEEIARPVEFSGERHNQVVAIAATALEESRRAEETLGSWVADGDAV